MTPPPQVDPEHQTTTVLTDDGDHRKREEFERKRLQVNAWLKKKREESKLAETYQVDLEAVADAIRKMLAGNCNTFVGHQSFTPELSVRVTRRAKSLLGKIEELIRLHGNPPEAVKKRRRSMRYFERIEQDGGRNLFTDEE